MMARAIAITGILSAKNTAPAPLRTPPEIALTAGPFAADRDAANGVPAAIVLSNNTNLDTQTANYVKNKLSATDLSAVTAIGGGAASAVRALPGAMPTTGPELFRPLYGANRFATAARVANVGWSYTSAPDVAYGPIKAPAIGLATGYGFPDALTGGAYMALNGGPLLLTDPAAPSGLAPETAAVLGRARGYTNIGDVFGGTRVLPKRVSDSMMYTMGITTYAIFGNQADG